MATWMIRVGVCRFLEARLFYFNFDQDKRGWPTLPSGQTVAFVKKYLTILNLSVWWSPDNLTLTTEEGNMCSLEGGDLVSDVCCFTA
jgi:hypothetical protein